MTGPTAGPTTWLDHPLRQDTLTHEPRCLTLSCILGCTLQVRAHSLAIATAESRPHCPVRAALVRACHVLPNFAPNSGTTLQLSPFPGRLAPPDSPALRSQSLRFSKLGLPDNFQDTFQHLRVSYQLFTSHKSPTISRQIMMLWSKNALKRLHESVAVVLNGRGTTLKIF